MEKLNLNDVKTFVNKEIAGFHKAKLDCLVKLDLKSILKKKNPYLFKAKNLNVASDLITGILDAYLSSSEEKLFGDFLEKLAVFIAEKTCNGWKSAATGIDLEFIDNDMHYLISIKSGPNWGNSSQQKKLELDLKTAVGVLKQQNIKLNVQPVLGICYGNTRTNYLRGYLKVTGQSFWHLISDNKDLYTVIIEPLGYKAKQHNDAFSKKKATLINKLTNEFLKDFCTDDEIDWKKLVQFNSRNMKKK